MTCEFDSEAIRCSLNLSNVASIGSAHHIGLEASPSGVLDGIRTEPRTHRIPNIQGDLQARKTIEGRDNEAAGRPGLCRGEEDGHV